MLFRSDEPPTIVGLYQETPLNQPCRDMYPRHGFIWDETDRAWVCRGDDDIADDPAWLEIQDLTA